MVKGEDGVWPVQVGRHHKLHHVAAPQVHGVAALHHALLEGAVGEALKVHEGHLGAHHLHLRVDVDHVRDQACTR